MACAAVTFFPWLRDAGAFESYTQMPPVQRRPLTQSWLLRHLLPLVQRGQILPPQSTSVSSPFLTPSLQVGGAHCPPEQTPEAHLLPHAPQLFGSVLVFISHPLAKLPSQSA